MGRSLHTALSFIRVRLQRFIFRQAIATNTSGERGIRLSYISLYSNSIYWSLLSYTTKFYQILGTVLSTCKHTYQTKAACRSLSRTPKKPGKVSEVQDLLFANCVWSSDGSRLWGFSFPAAAAADFDNWLALCTYLAQFHILRLTCKGSYSSLTQVDLL